MDADKERQLKHTLKRIRETGDFEGICLQGWQCKLLIEYITELEKGREKIEKD